MRQEEDWIVLRQLLAHMLGERRPEELASALLEHFGSLSSLVESISMHNDSPPISDNLRMLLSMVPELCQRRELDRIGPNPLMNTLSAACRYAAALYIGAQYEQICLLCLAADFRLKEHRMLIEGGLREVPFYPRRLMQEALRVDAQAIILCHNHPSGWAFFSEADVAATREFLSLCAQIQLPLLDHLLIANKQVSSMRSRAYIPERNWSACSPLMPSVAQWRGASSDGRFEILPPSKS